MNSSYYKKLIQELNDKFVGNQNDKISDNEKIKYVSESKDNAAVFKSLPKTVSKQLALERDSCWNVQISLIATERLLADIVVKTLDQWKKERK